MIETEDVVERFRAQILISSNIRGGSLNHLEDHEVRAVVRAAVAASGSADTIERLREENARRGEALKSISNGSLALDDGSDYARGWNAARYRMSVIARTALNQQ